MRAGAAARHLAALDPALGARVLAVIVRGAGGELRAAAAAIARALADPRVGELPYPWLADAYAAAVEEGLDEVTALLVSPPPRKAWIEPRDKTDQRLAHLTLGHKKALARANRDPDLLARLAAEGDPVVVRELLANPQLTEDFVVRIAARRPCRPSTLRCIWTRAGGARGPPSRSPSRGTRTPRRASRSGSCPCSARPSCARSRWTGALHPLVRALADRIAMRRLPEGAVGVSAGSADRRPVPPRRRQADRGAAGGRARRPSAARGGRRPRGSRRTR